MYECPVWAIPIVLNGVAVAPTPAIPIVLRGIAVAPTPEIEEWSGLNET